MRVDFHMHTTCSDGLVSPPELLVLAKRARLEAWAITDHDTLDAYVALRTTPGLIPGVEVTSQHQGREVHVVGLGVNPDCPVFANFLADIRAVRHQRLAALCLLVNKNLGLNLDPSRITNSPSPSRQHLAWALQHAGRVAHSSQAFLGILNDEALKDVDLPPFPDLPVVSAAIRAAGGVAILAHPAVYPSIDLVEQLCQHCDGLEVNHPQADALRQATYRTLVAKYCLFASTGSDFHWPGKRELGDRRLPRSELNPLLDRLSWDTGRCSPRCR